MRPGMERSSGRLSADRVVQSRALDKLVANQDRTCIDAWTSCLYLVTLVVLLAHPGDGGCPAGRGRLGTAAGTRVGAGTGSFSARGTLRPRCDAAAYRAGQRGRANRDCVRLFPWAANAGAPLETPAGECGSLKLNLRACYAHLANGRPQPCLSAAWNHRAGILRGLLGETPTEVPRRRRHCHCSRRHRRADRSPGRHGP